MNPTNEQISNEEDSESSDLNEQLDAVLKILNNSKGFEINFSKLNTSQTSSYSKFRQKFLKKNNKSVFRVICSYWDIILLSSLNLFFFLVFSLLRGFLLQSFAQV